MTNRNKLVMLPIAALTMCLLGGNAHAVLIDDFNGGYATVPDPDTGANVVTVAYLNTIDGYRQIGLEVGSDAITGSLGVTTGGVLVFTGNPNFLAGRVRWVGSSSGSTIDPPADLTDGGSSDRFRVNVSTVDPYCEDVELNLSVVDNNGLSSLVQIFPAPGPNDVTFASFTGSLDFQAIQSIELGIEAAPPPGQLPRCVVINSIETVEPPAGNQAPIADVGGPYAGAVGTAIVFDGSGSSDPEGTNLTYAWKFGDGQTGAGPNPGHTYTMPSTYHVTLTVTDDAGVPASASTTASVGGLSQQPVADAGGPYTGTRDVPVVFDASGSSDPEGTDLTYDWLFGDGTALDDAGPTPSHAYALAIRHTVTLTVTNAFGEDNAVATYVTIADGNQPPRADAGGPYTGVAGDLIRFDGSGSSDPDGSIVSYDWNFGDGSPVAVDAGDSPFHRYDEKGFYHVVVTVTDEFDVANSDTTVAGIQSGDALDCSTAVPSTDVIWPANRKLVAIDVLGVTDLGGDPASITIDSIFQDEPVGIRVDGSGVGTDTALVRAHRLSSRLGGNGRVYHIGFTADDGQGESCTGNVTVSVPTLHLFDAVDDGANFDSTVTGN